jgi:DNA-binding LacI/PurR family transcriptional regulator
MSDLTKNKYMWVRDSILSNIRSGKYNNSGKLPALRTLASDFGVSYLTARKAVNDLIENSMIESRNREGLYLSSDAGKRVNSQVLHVICTSYENATVRQFLRAAQQCACAFGFKPHVLRLNSDQHQSFIRSLRSGDKCLVLADRTFLNRSSIAVMQDFAANVVVIGADLSMLGINSVLCNSCGINMAIDMLKNCGHRNIAMLAHKSGDAEEVQISTWRSCFSDQNPDDVESRLIWALVEPFDCCSPSAYQAVSEYLKSSKADATAMICLLDEAVVGAMSACRHAGLNIPEDMSFVCIGDSPVLSYLHPAVSCVDKNIMKHVEIAMEMFDSSSDAPKLRLVSPTFIKRDLPNRT